MLVILCGRAEQSPAPTGWGAQKNRPYQLDIYTVSFHAIPRQARNKIVLTYSYGGCKRRYKEIKGDTEIEDIKNKGRGGVDDIIHKEVGEVDDFMWKGGMVLVILREGRAEPCPYGVGMQKGDTRKQQGIQRKQQGDIKKQKGGCKRKSGKREKKNRQYRQS